MTEKSLARAKSGVPGGLTNERLKPNRLHAAICQRVAFFTRASVYTPLSLKLRLQVINIENNDTDKLKSAGPALNQNHHAAITRLL